jgi:uncharacterized protein YxeA
MIIMMIIILLLIIIIIIIIIYIYYDDDDEEEEEGEEEREEDSGAELTKAKTETDDAGVHRKANRDRNSAGQLPLLDCVLDGWVQLVGSNSCKIIISV